MLSQLHICARSGQIKAVLYQEMSHDVLQYDRCAGARQSVAAVTLAKGIGPHELVPVECEVLVLIIIVIQQLPEVLLPSQNLYTSLSRC